MPAQRKTRPNARRNAGFTMIEMMVAVSIIIILIAAGIGGMRAVDTASRRSQTMLILHNAASIATEYQAITGLPPAVTTTTEFVKAVKDVESCVNMLNSLGDGVYDGVTIYDGWGNEVIYRNTPRAHFISKGSDYTLGTSDDISTLSSVD